MSVWHGAPGSVSGVVAVSIAGLPVATLAAALLARRRLRQEQDPASARRSAVADIGLWYGTAPWVWMTLLPSRGPEVAPSRMSLVPLRDLTAVLTGAPLTVAVQVIGNLLVFAALGFFGPLRFAALSSPVRVLLVAAACSMALETAQFGLQLGRVSSVDDVLLNAVGAALAALASRRFRTATTGFRPTGSPPHVSTPGSGT